MSLVDYASSSDDDVTRDIEEQEQEQENQQQQEEGKSPQLEQHARKHGSSPSAVPPSDQRSGLLLSQSSESVGQPLPSLQEKLPDASLLLNSPALSLVSAGGGTDHVSRVSAAMAESASRRKRDSSGSSLPRGKMPRGTFPNTKSVPDTGGGMLVPPQLSGRSNVVTEDIGKLFLRRQT